MTRIPWRYTGCANTNLPTSRFMKSSDTHRVIHTSKPKLYTTPLRGCSDISKNLEGAVAENV